ncbi:hypothetical protein MOQ_004522 [Trypanosoma cruzi marinkellei]|uniref:Ribosomal RNA-processing protein 7 C-terminal domain-containing protein n=1 Tax=Trypanosoma cruzi marinkellei TaxID=85056 RepID=K2N109_TRYCR|nr:hypothetical protein MOQ_004522 [Trypanosoma cruzi marinkellei]
MAKKKSGTAALLPELTVNRRYIKKMKFLVKRREAAAAAARRGKNGAKKKQKKGGARHKTGDVTKGSGRRKQSNNAAAKKSSGVSAKKEKAAAHGSPGKNRRRNISDAGSGAASQQQKQLSREEIDQQMIARAIRGDEGTRNASLSAGASSGGDVDDLVQYPYLPFLEDYAEQKRSEVVSADTLLSNAHAYFKDLGRKESAMRRAAARRLKELKNINRRGGDKDGFRYVVPRNVKEVVRQMMQNAEGADASGVDKTQLTSTFGGDEAQDTFERPMHRKRRKNSCYSDFYQFQVSKRWTRNAETFLNRGRAYKSMVEASRPQRSIKKF